MKNTILGLATGIIVMLLMSYTGTNGVHVDGQGYNGYSLPLKQKNFIVTENYDYAKSLMKKGYVLEDVDIVGKFISAYERSKIFKYYTMVKY